jgi:hypothetical protein
MNREDRAQYRQLLAKEYKIKTGYDLICLEKDGIRKENKEIDKIIKAAETFFKTPLPMMLSKNKSRQVSKYKQMLIKKISEQDYTQEAIADRLDGMGRSGISYHISMFDNNISKEPYKQVYEQFTEYCKTNE